MQFSLLYASVGLNVFLYCVVGCLTSFCPQISFVSPFNNHIFEHFSLIAEYMILILPLISGVKSVSVICVAEKSSKRARLAILFAIDPRFFLPHPKKETLYILSTSMA